MQARKLKRLLAVKSLIVGVGETGILIGFGHNFPVILINKETFRTKVRPGSHDISPIIKIIEELKESGELRTIIDGQDTIENPLPVFYVNREGILVETSTDAYGWPNTTIDGDLMYDNTYFNNRDSAIRDGVERYTELVDQGVRHMEDHKLRFKELEDKWNSRVNILNKLIAEKYKDV